MKTDYGAIVGHYQRYKTDHQDGELRLGTAPALAALGDVRGKTVLDFGCGPATISKSLREAGAIVIGFDADPRVIEVARQNDPQSDYRVYGGLLAQEVAGRRIDLVLMSFSFCVIPDREVRYILRDMRSLLGEKGKLVIIEPNQEKAHGIQYRNLHYLEKPGVQTGDLVEVMLGSGDDAMLLTDDIYRRHTDYRNLLEEAGFSIEVIEEPMPGDDWDGEWETERKYPPFLLIVAT